MYVYSKLKTKYMPKLQNKLCKSIDMRNEYKNDISPCAELQTEIECPLFVYHCRHHTQQKYTNHLFPTGTLLKLTKLCVSSAYFDDDMCFRLN